MDQVGTVALPLPVEDKTEVKLGVSTCAHPLVHKHCHVLARHCEYSLGEDDGAD